MILNLAAGVVLMLRGNNAFNMFVTKGVTMFMIHDSSERNSTLRSNLFIMTWIKYCTQVLVAGVASVSALGLLSLVKTDGSANFTPPASEPSLSRRSAAARFACSSSSYKYNILSC